MLRILAYGTTKSKNSIKTQTAVDTCAKATSTKDQKVIEKKQKKQTRQKAQKLLTKAPN